MSSRSTSSVQSRIDAYWTGRADGYAAYQRERAATPEVQDAWREVWSSALPAPPATVLDVGTGNGQVAWLLAELGHRVTAIDTSDGMLDEARRSGPAERELATPPRFGHGDAVAPPVEPGTLDAITARYVLWTLREPDRALATWRSCLRPGGRLAVVDSTWFADGVDRGTSGGRLDGDVFREHYDDEVLDALPLAEAASIDATVERVRQAGYDDVEVRPLHRLLALDHRYGVAPNHRAQLQYLITGRAPA